MMLKQEFQLIREGRTPFLLLGGGFRLKFGYHSMQPALHWVSSALWESCHLQPKLLWICAPWGAQGSLRAGFLLSCIYIQPLPHQSRTKGPKMIFGGARSGFEAAEVDFQGKTMGNCINPITWFYLNPLAEIIHLR